MPKKRKHSAVTMSATNSNNNNKNDNDSFNQQIEKTKQSFSNSPFCIVKHAKDAKSLTDGVQLLQDEVKTETKKKQQQQKDTNNINDPVIMPWVGYGTYGLKRDKVGQCFHQALKQGYRCFDTAFIYGGETTEKLLGAALQDELQDQSIIQSRRDIFLISKHWRKYHGYEPTLECLQKSLNRLQVDYLDLWLIHWPGPAWKTMNRKKDLIQQHGKWYYATTTPEELPNLRSETWRAMEDALRQGKVKAIGVSNFTVSHLQRLKQTATIWPPAVNQVEYHPCYPQTQLIEYCAQEGIVLQAYASLGGQDTGKSFWKQVYKNNPKHQKANKLWESPPVKKLVLEINDNNNQDTKNDNDPTATTTPVTAGQVLLRWGLDKNCAVIPKTESSERMAENANIFHFSLSQSQMSQLERQLAIDIREVSSSAEQQEKNENQQELLDQHHSGRFCWKRDPLRHLEFE